MSWEPPEEAKGCWIHGDFYYYPLLREMDSIRAEVEFMGDADLIEEVSCILEFDELEVDDIIYAFLKMGSLYQEDREKLILFYITASIQDYLVIDEEEEW